MTALSGKRDPADFEALSAYIDNQLSPSERTALEARLQAEPDLRAELTSLQETVTLLHALPKLKAPRNFTLDPAMYGAAPVAERKTIRPFFGRAAAVASLAASVVMVVAGVLLLGSPETTDAPAPVAQIDTTTEETGVMTTAPFDAANEESADRSTKESSDETATPEASVMQTFGDTGEATIETTAGASEAERAFNPEATPQPNPEVFYMPEGGLGQGGDGTDMGFNPPAESSEGEPGMGGGGGDGQQNAYDDPFMNPPDEFQGPPVVVSTVVTIQVTATPAVEAAAVDPVGTEAQERDEADEAQVALAATPQIESLASVADPTDGVEESAPESQPARQPETPEEEDDTIARLLIALGVVGGILSLSGLIFTYWRR